MRRLGPGDRIVALGALALFVFLFFVDWYGSDITGLPRGSRIEGGTVSATGWETFTSSRWVWLATIAIALGSVLAATSGFKLDGPVQIGAVVFGTGLLSSVLILYRIVHHPGENASLHGLHITYGIKLGIWLGLLAALAIAAGGYLQLLAEGRTGAEEADGPAEEEPGSAFSGLTLPGQKRATGGPPPGNAR